MRSSSSVKCPVGRLGQVEVAVDARRDPRPARRGRSAWADGSAGSRPSADRRERSCSRSGRASSISTPEDAASRRRLPSSSRCSSSRPGRDEAARCGGRPEHAERAVRAPVTRAAASTTACSVSSRSSPRAIAVPASTTSASLLCAAGERPCGDRRGYGICGFSAATSRERCPDGRAAERRDCSVIGARPRRRRCACWWLRRHRPRRGAPSAGRRRCIATATTWR